MTYTTSQKEIIRELAEGKYSNIWEYLIWITPEERQKFQKNRWEDTNFNWHICFADNTFHENGSYLIQIDSNTKVKLLDFIKISQDLRYHNLIISLTPKSRYIVNLNQNTNDLNVNDKENSSTIRQLLNSNLPSEPSVDNELITKENFYSLPALHEFIKNNFKTAEELKQEEQTKYLDNQLQLLKENHQDQLKIQKTSLSWTKGIAITSIVLSLLTICLTIYNNTQPSDRNVTLKNPTDTIRVINISPANGNSNIKRTLDSTKIDSTQ